MQTDTYRDNLVTSSQITTQVGRGTGQYEWNEDSFAIFTADNVETQSRRPSNQNHCPLTPGQKRKAN